MIKGDVRPLSTPQWLAIGACLLVLQAAILPRAPWAGRLVLAIMIEGCWETGREFQLHHRSLPRRHVSLDYYGDSIVNSVSDTLSMVVGFKLDETLPPSATVALAVAFELLVGLHIRDNLTLNIIMLLYPLDAIRQWQAGGPII